MDYLFLDQNALIWLMFAIYTVSALSILPNAVESISLTTTNKDVNDRVIQFASRFIMRIALILPMILIIKNTI